MKKKTVVIYFVLLLISAGATFIFSVSNGVFYTTQGGVELNKTQYDRIRNVYTLEDINILPSEYINELKEYKDLKLIDSNEITVESRTYYDEKNQPVRTVHKIVTKKENINMVSKRLMYGWAK